ncbi:MAG: nucleoside triphosphate pyrophosphohydrolase, partial [Oscillospiraceae bacterium]
MQLKDKYNINDLLEIMKILRAQCPWDKQQTHKTIRNNFIEETYEAVEAIDTDDYELLKEELGDVLLQVIFHSQMASEKDIFDFNDVCNDIVKKLIERHPHIFGDVKVNSTEDVLNNWNEIKKKQKGQETATKNLQSVSRSLPALMRSEKVQDRARKAGFDYPNVSMALDDLKSEIIELENAMKDNSNIEEE